MSNSPCARGLLGAAAPLGLAVIGAGYWGPNLVRASAASGRFLPRWVCDTDPSRAQVVAGGSASCRATTVLAEVLADPAVDAVAIATPAGTHAQIAEAALAAGKHVLIEKPLATSSVAGRALVAQAGDAGRVLMCDHTYCYTPAVDLIRELIAAGEIGDVLFVDSIRVNLGLIQTDVDVVWDLAPHDLAILDAVLPDGCRPASVAAFGADPVGAGQACLAYLNLRLPTGIPVGIQLNWLSPVKMRRITIGGSRRTIVWDDMNPAMRVSVYDRGVDALPGDRRSREVSYRLGDVTSPALVEREPLVAMFEEFGAAIAETRRPRTDGAAGLRVLETLEAASRSMASGGIDVPVAAGIPTPRPAVPRRRPLVPPAIPRARTADRAPSVPVEVA